MEVRRHLPETKLSKVIDDIYVYLKDHIHIYMVYSFLNECFQGYTGICLSVRVSVSVQNTTLCQSAGIKSHSVTALALIH